MSVDIKNTGAYERDIEQNWAAAYAKRLVEQESDDRDSAIAAAIEEEEGKRVSSDNAIKDGTALQDGCVRTRHIYPGDVTTGCIHALAVNEDKLANGAVTKDKLAPESVYSSNIKNNAVMRGHLSSSATLRLNSSSNGNFTIEYCDGAPIDAIQYGTVSFIASIDNIPLRDSAAQEWISNNCVIRSGDPPASANDADFVPHDGLLYLQLDLTTITNIFVLCGGTPLGNLYWKQIYPAFSEYSSTPQQVGTWIDGQQIYRVAIQKTLSSSALSNRVYSLSKEDIGVNILDEVSAILNAEFGQYDNYADSTVKVPCSMDSGFNIALFDTNLNVLKGYIEFVTVEENIAS